MWFFLLEATDLFPLSRQLPLWSSLNLFLIPSLWSLNHAYINLTGGARQPELQVEIKFLLGKEWTNSLCLSITSFPFTRGTPNQFFSSCQKHLLSWLSSAALRPSYCCQGSALGPHTLPSWRSDPSTFSLQLTATNSRAKPSLVSALPVNFLHDPRANPEVCGEEVEETVCGYVAEETFEKRLPNYAGMSAKARVNLDGVTGNSSPTVEMGRARCGLPEMRWGWSVLKVFWEPSEFS